MKFICNWDGKVVEGNPALIFRERGLQFCEECLINNRTEIWKESGYVFFHIFHNWERIGSKQIGTTRFQGSSGSWPAYITKDKCAECEIIRYRTYSFMWRNDWRYGYDYEASDEVVWNSH